MSAIFRSKLALAKAVGAASRASGRGGGTSLPGKVLLRLEADSISRLAAGLEQGSVVISATNGKTTTASLLAGILRESGTATVHNRAGANMAGGIATALLESAKDGVASGELGLFEVDEAWTAEIVAALEPRVVVLANLFRDQLDRYGELESLADAWQVMVDALPDSSQVVLNADDPLLAGIGAGRPNSIFFGVSDTSLAEGSPRHAADSKHCRICGAALVYDAVQLGHLGIYHCPNGDFVRPEPEITVTAIESRGMKGSEIEIATPNGPISADLPIPGLYNVYNAVAAAAAAHALRLESAAIGSGLAGARAVFGRVETLEIGRQTVALLLIKNPTGANEVLRTIAAEGHDFDLWIALNDKIADGRDVSWVWDADFELLTDHVNRITCSGTRAEEIALRLALAGVDRDRIEVDRRIERSFDAAVVSARKAAMPIYALPTYTALLELRTAIARRGDAADYWSER